MKNELHKVGEKTYYIESSTNIGLYIIEGNDVAIIDTGFSEMGPIILDILDKNNFNLRYIICTHSHADHCGANIFLMEHTDCEVITSRIERAFLRNSKLDIGFLAGGYPLDEFDNDLMHIEEHKNILHLFDLPKGLSYFKLPGHHYDMFGIRTSDDIYFVADAIGNQRTIGKYHIMLIYDVEGYLQSMEYIKKLDGKLVIPSHSEATYKISPLVEINRAKMFEIIDYLFSILENPLTHDEILKIMFDHYELTLTYNQYLIAGYTIRGYLAYLSNKKVIKTIIRDNRFLYEINK